MKNPGNTAATYTATQKPPLKPSITLKLLELSKCFPVRTSTNPISKLIISCGCVRCAVQENFLDSYP